MSSQDPGGEIPRPQVTIVYPAYNEEASIEQTIRRSTETLQSLFADYEVLIINDGSLDETGRIVDALAECDPRIRVIHNEFNLGQGDSLRHGLIEAQGEFVAHNGVDYPFDLKDLAQMMPLARCADIVVAVRRGRPGYTRYRTVISIVNIKLIRLLFPLKLGDYSFVQLYRRDVLHRIRPDSTSTGFMIPELLIRAHDAGMRIEQMDIDYHPRLQGKATAGQPAVVLSSVRDMICFWWKRRGAQRRSP